MKCNGHTRFRWRDDRGVSILIIAVSMVFVLGIAGLGIDLASLYVGRSQAQRAADAAALAGAQALASDNVSCVNGSGGNITSGCQALARQAAEAVGNQNLIAGVSPGITDTDITFPSTSTSDPQIQVIAARDANHNNPMPTFFVKIFGINTANVSAKAIAEAYSSNGQGPPVGARCVKPWLIPNCDPGNTSGTANPLCGSGVGSFVDVSSGGLSSTPSRDGMAPGGAIGEAFTLKPGDPGGAAAPGQYYAAYIPNTTQFATECPACASNVSGGGSTTNTGSAAVYRTNIECCNNNPIVCGSNNITLASTAGNMVGPTQQGVDCLIHQSGSSWSSNCGQDRMNGNSNPCGAPPVDLTQPSQLAITAGPNNPYLNDGANVPSTHSDSVVGLPIWDGTPLSSGQNPSVNIVGFLKLFIQYEGNPQGTVYGTVLGVTACGNGSSGGTSNGGPIVAPGGSTIPVRLIHE